MDIDNLYPVKGVSKMFVLMLICASVTIMLKWYIIFAPQNLFAKDK